MKYALWSLKEDEPNYLTGPESKIVEMGGSAEASWTNGIVEHSADILGYVNGEFDVTELAHWDYKEISQEQALAFCQSINPEAYLLTDGRIAAPFEPFITIG